LKKHLKYIISLFLVFGLMVNDCDLYSQSTSEDYYQFSNVILRGESNSNSFSLYQFDPPNSINTTSSPILFACLEFKGSYSHQIWVLLKTQKLIHQEVSSILSQSIFINEMITSRITYKNLYIA
jgi:hypothetical protein